MLEILSFFVASGTRVISERLLRYTSTMIDHVEVTCPWCFETVEMAVEADVEGAFVQDCEVCCHPWSVRASRDDEGQLSVEVDRA